MTKIRELRDRFTPFFLPAVGVSGDQALGVIVAYLLSETLLNLRREEQRCPSIARAT